RHLYLVILLALSFSCYRSRVHPYSLSFPTRRSSDLAPGAGGNAAYHRPPTPLQPATQSQAASSAVTTSGTLGRCARPDVVTAERSEEHTSELQSRENLVCRLLLEKKKQKNQIS